MCRRSASDCLPTHVPACFTAIFTAWNCCQNPFVKKPNKKLSLFIISLSRATRVDLEIKTVVSRAVALAREYGVKPLDALHLAAAIIGQADRFVTTEGSTSPILRVREIKVETFAD